MAEVKKHVRVNDIFLGPLERPALQFFCRHMPAWVTPDIMTFTGVVGAVLIATGYILTRYNMAFLWLASFGFFVNWFGDSLDGTLARFRKIERPKYGYYVDHIVDIVDEFIVIISMGFSPLVNFEVAGLALIGYLMLSVHTFLRTYVDDVFKISFSKLGPTEVRALIILANTTIFFVGNPVVFNLFGLDFTIFDLFISAIGILLYSFFLSSSVQYSLYLAKKGE